MTSASSQIFRNCSKSSLTSSLIFSASSTCCVCHVARLSMNIVPASCNVVVFPTRFTSFLSGQGDLMRQVPICLSLSGTLTVTVGTPSVHRSSRILSCLWPNLSTTTMIFRRALLQKIFPFAFSQRIASLMVTSAPFSRSEHKVRLRFLSRLKEHSKSSDHRHPPIDHENQVHGHPFVNSFIHHRLLVHCLLGFHTLFRGQHSSAGHLLLDVQVVLQFLATHQVVASALRKSF